MSESLKGFCTALIRDPLCSQIKATWDPLAPPFSGVKIIWWRVGGPVIESSWVRQFCTQFLIRAKPGETYIVAARAYYPFSYLGPWAYVVVEVPQAEQPRHTCRLEVIDTPRGPAILLEELRDVL